MSFDTVKLSSSVLSNLYKQVVVTDDHDTGRAALKQELKSEAAMGTDQVKAPVPPVSVKQSAPPETSTYAAPDTTVVQPPAPVAAPVTMPVREPDAPYRFLGKNARRVAVIVYSPYDAFLPDDQLMLLTKMLDACKLNLGDVAIINHATQAVEIDQLNAQLRPERTILFGVQPENIGLPLSFPPFKEQEYAGCTYLLATSLADMNQPTEEGKLLKGKLWGCLKKMFNI